MRKKRENGEQNKSEIKCARENATESELVRVRKRERKENERE